ncbi:MAG: helix-turn-helix domain-containing protein [Streptosporangiaceae bacterium]
MAADQGPVVQSALLRSELVRLRKERGLTQQQVARELEWSASKLIRVEGGASSITKVDLDALLSKYGVTSESHRERLQSLNRAAKERGWWDSYRDYVSPAYLHYVGLEAGAAFIRQFQIGFIPGLLQTPEYARVVTEVGSVDPQKVGPIVELRLRRRSELAQREAKPRQYFVIDEAVIHRHVGIKKNRAIMPNQLRSIAERADRDNLVTVRVIPFESGAHPGLFDSFTLLEFEGGRLPDALYLEAAREEFTMIAGNDPQAAKYAEDFEELLEDALSAQRSIELIRHVAEEMS